MMFSMIGGVLRVEIASEKHKYFHSIVDGWELSDFDMPGITICCLGKLYSGLMIYVYTYHSGIMMVIPIANIES